MSESETFVFRRVDDVLPLAYRLAMGCERNDLVAIGLAELMMNAIEHGIAGLGFDGKRQLLDSGRLREELELRLIQPPGRERSARVSADRFADLVRFRIQDDGPGFDWRNWIEADESRIAAPNGRGIALARSLCFESLNYVGAGNMVEAVALRSVPAERP